MKQSLIAAPDQVREVANKVERGERISTADATVLWREASDEELRRLAGVVRARYHDPRRATYMVMRIINYTNVCVAQCDYCAFYVLPNQRGGYVLTREDVFAKIDELLELGGDLVGFNGGFNPKLPLHYYCDLFAAVRERYAHRVEFYALTIAEFMFLADRAGLSYPEAAARLRDAGVFWITGGGSEILTEDFRKRHAKFKYTVREYFQAQRAVVETGLRTTATMVIGFDESLEERLSTWSAPATSRTPVCATAFRGSSPSSAGRTSPTGRPSPGRRSPRASTTATWRSRASSWTTCGTSAPRCSRRTRRRSGGWSTARTTSTSRWRTR